MNVLVLIFGVNAFYLIVKYILSSDFQIFLSSNESFFISLITLLLTVLAFSVLKSNLRKSFILNQDNDYKLLINSKIEFQKINHRNQINYSNNFIIDKEKQYEIDNRDAFNILNHKFIKDVYSEESGIMFLMIDSNELIEKIRSFISDGISILMHK